MSKFAVIIAAAGQSARFGDPFQKKVFTLLAGKPLWMYSAEAFAKRNDVEQVILVIAAEDRELFNEKFAGNAAMLGIKTVLGGATRSASVRNGLDSVDPQHSWVAVHDAARPCISGPSIDAVFDATKKSGAAILATACHSTLKRVGPDHKIIETVPRDGLWLAQTPQCFEVSLLRKAYAEHPDADSATDESSLVQSLGHPIAVVEGSPMNIKVTNKSDLKFAEMALKALPQPKAFPF